MDNIRRQYARNADGLAQMLAKAIKTGRKVNGYTADQLRESVTEYRRLSTLDDAQLREHFAAAQARFRKRCYSPASPVRPRVS